MSRTHEVLYVAQLYCPSFELVQRMQNYQKDYHKYQGNIEESCRASASHYVALSQLFNRIVSNIAHSSGYDESTVFLFKRFMKHVWDVNLAE